MKIAKNYNDFKLLANDENLTKYQKISFPDICREDYERDIFKDITSKLSNLNDKNQKVLDIGCGCSDLPKFIIEHCKNNNNIITLIDNEEMLNLIDDEVFIKKIPGLFPLISDIDKFKNSFDVIICYSVLHYVLSEVSFMVFLDTILSLLKLNGQLLIGDIPNMSKSKRFFAGESSLMYSNPLLTGEERENVKFNNIDFYEIDDSIVFSIVQRARLSGFNAYILPQNKNLFTTNFREDILIEKV